MRRLAAEFRYDELEPYLACLEAEISPSDEDGGPNLLIMAVDAQRVDIVREIVTNFRYSV